MKKITLSTAMLFFVIAAFSQKEEKNGTIYIKHPYIDLVLKANSAFMENDETTAKKFYADTARIWTSGMTKYVNSDEAFESWKKDFANYDSVKLTLQPHSYPDFLHYKDKDAKTVQTWWVWSGRSKKTGESLQIPFVQFDYFNKDGKIIYEIMYGDFSKME